MSEKAVDVCSVIPYLVIPYLVIPYLVIPFKGEKNHMYRQRRRRQGIQLFAQRGMVVPLLGMMVLAGILLASLLAGSNGLLSAQGTGPVYQLDAEAVDVAVHELGGHWEGGSGDGPLVTDFGGGGADAPVAGLEQWLSAKGYAPAQPDADVLGAQRVIVLRTRFNDYGNATRFTQAEVEGFFDELNTLWKNTSYGKISIDYQVTALFALPDDRTDYVDDLPPCESDPAIRPNGDLSCDGKFDKVLNDAIANSPNTLDWTDIDAVMVVMSETDNSQFHRGQGSGSCNLRMGPGGSVKNVGCAIFSENPTETERQVWGRWAHEIGHAFQQAGPAHPSNYNSEFELMDSNYPGQTGVFEKQADQGFPGWMPGGKYVLVNKDNGGERICLWAMEYDPLGNPVPQAIRADITGSLYYLISVRRQVLGDDLNGGFPNGIPDEGVLIERVVEGADQWVTVQGKGGDRNRLWQEGDLFDGGADGVQIVVDKKVDEDNYCVTVRFDKRAIQPDVMLDPWTSPPGNTWETTDIWVDSPVNGFGTYRYGQWNDLDGNLVPRGNGDDPAVGMVNRLYARVRNRGTQTATNVKVNFEITDPPGLGIAGANGWAGLGSVDSATFPGLAAIAPGSFVDVYLEWTPNIALTPEQIAAGTFYFHTCVRVKLDPVAGETILGNQDGDREQENISYFQAVPPSQGGSVLDRVITLRNPDLVNPKWFSISYETDIPAGWLLEVNEGRTGVEVPPGGTVEIPVFIKPQGPAVVGSIFGVDVSASSLELLIDDKNPKDRHPGYDTLGGARVEARVMIPPKLSCSALDQGPNEIFVSGELAGTEQFFNEKEPFSVYVIGVDGARSFMPETGKLLQVTREGKFEGTLAPSRNKKNAEEVVCIFAGTEELASASSGYVQVRDNSYPGPLATPTRTPQPTWTPLPTNTPTPGPTNTPTPEIQIVPWVPPGIIILDPPNFASYDLSIFGIEVTQGIQCFDTSKGLAGCPDNSLPLVTKKSTTARVYLKYSSAIFDQRSNTPVTLYLRKDGGAWETVTTTATARKELDQSDAANSANFFFTINGDDSVLVDLYAVVDATGSLSELNEGNNRYPASGYLTLTFRPRSDLDIVGSRLRWDPAGSDGPWTAGDGSGSGTSGWTVNAGAALWLNQLLPLGDGELGYSVASGYRDWTGSMSSSDQHALIEQLNGEYALALIFALLFGGDVNSLVDHHYAWIPNDRSTFGHADMPVYPHAGGLGVVAIGTDDPGSSTDNPGPGVLIFGHEVVHDYDIYHTNTGGDDCGSNDSNSDFPYATSSIQEFGFNPLTGKVYDPSTTHDLMSYCPSGGSKQGWIAPFTWNRMFNNLDGTTVAAADAPYGPNAVVAEGPNGVGTIFRTTDQQSLVVAATVFNPDQNSGKQSGKLGALHLVGDGYNMNVPAGDYSIQLRQGSQVLAERSFVVNFESEYHTGGDKHGTGPDSPEEEPVFDPNPTTQVGVSLILPWVEGADNVALVFGETVLDQRVVTTNAPTVSITDPSGPEAWKAGATETLAWKGDDQDGDTLTYSVFYSYDAGKNWQLLAANLTEPGLTLEVDSLAGGNDVRFRVVATDGINVGIDESQHLISVPNKRPQVVIMEPMDRVVVAPNGLVVFQGGATDLEDGTLSGASLHWESDVQGSLGVGTSLAFTQLQPGPHVITLSAVDRFGLRGEATVNVFVGYRINLPQVKR